jgi:hypothetical protein
MHQRHESLFLNGVMVMLFRSPMSSTYDIFLSHAWSDGDRHRVIVYSPTKKGLRVW